MVSWNNFDKLESYNELMQLKDEVDIAKEMSGENGVKRVMNYNIPMSSGLTYNYAAKQVDNNVIDALASLATEAGLDRKSVV